MRLLRGVFLAVLLVCMAMGIGLYQIAFSSTMQANGVAQVLTMLTLVGILGSGYGLHKLRR